MKRWQRQAGLIERFFHEEEIKSARAKGPAAEALSLAARFAAKEAFGKALGTGLSGIRLSDIRVANNHNGKPSMHLEGSALAAFKRMGGARIHLSLTHESDNALAMIVIED
jgi:holo-[acyl-carrier protein] synthase